MVHVIRIAWETYLALEGLTMEDCPVERLWSGLPHQPGSEGARRAEAASSSSAPAQSSETVAKRRRGST